MIKLLYAQNSTNDVTTSGLDSSKPRDSNTWSCGSELLPDFSTYPCKRYGITVDMWVKGGSQSQTLLSAGSSSLVITISSSGVANVTLTDNSTTPRRVSWHTDPVCSARLRDSGTAVHQLALIADGGPKMLMWVVDGHLCDGGPHGICAGHDSTIAEGEPAGWFLFDEALGSLRSNQNVVTGPRVVAARLYNRALYVSELIGNFRAGPPR